MNKIKTGLDQVDVRLVLKKEKTLFEGRECNSTEKAMELVKDLLKELNREHLCVLNLDNKLKVINYSIVGIGNINSCMVSIPDVLRVALLSNASSIILMHNHPSGEVEPSKEDDFITEKLIKAAKIINIPLIDHIIVGAGENKVYSYREKSDVDFCCDVCLDFEISSEEKGMEL